MNKLRSEHENKGEEEQMDKWISEPMSEQTNRYSHHIHKWLKQRKWFEQLRLNQLIENEYCKNI
jgi:hypothetical protein